VITILHTESSLGWGGQERRIMRELLGLSRDAFRPVLACRPESRIAEKARKDNLDCGSYPEFGRQLDGLRGG
jgi:hypothetical protein